MSLTTNMANLRITRGDTVIHRISVKNTDETVKDITGATVRYTIRTPRYTGTQVLQKTVGNGVVLTTPLSGILDVTLSGVETAALIPDTRYVYDCEIILSGQISTVQEGMITIVGDISY
mgnify:CR=1 FL=1